ncbi:MAG: hypothetical protein CVV49_16235 [Spirochaetae bacterium HGW-Spirochaetae-5]|nr:MAG: hypothetical protein CVV49_16235 [Spirochaetae bacterium HGW-Spirochaetae-5]
MRIKILLIMILPLLLVECKSTLWNAITKKESKLYTDSELIMLEEVTASIDFRYGFEPDLKLDYVFKAGRFTDKEIQSKAPEMKKVLAKYKPEEIISFYGKIVQMRDAHVSEMNEYRQDEDWNDATYIEKYILPEAELFLDILEKNMMQINSSYGDEIKKIKTKNLIK